MTSNWVNMVIALAACLALVVVIIILAPQPKGDPTRTVDAAAQAQAAQGSAGFKPAAPEAPSGWHANEASLDQMGKPEQSTWYVSYVGPGQQWITLRQAKPEERGESAAEAEQTWVTSVVGKDAATLDTADVDGIRFQQYQKPDQKQALVGKVRGTTVVLMGTGDWKSFEDFAHRIIAQK